MSWKGQQSLHQSTPGSLRRHTSPWRSGNLCIPLRTVEGYTKGRSNLNPHPTLWSGESSAHLHSLISHCHFNIDSMENRFCMGVRRDRDQETHVWRNGEPSLPQVNHSESLPAFTWHAQLTFKVWLHLAFRSPLQQTVPFLTADD